MEQIADIFVSDLNVIMSEYLQQPLIIILTFMIIDILFRLKAMIELSVFRAHCNE